MTDSTPDNAVPADGDSFVECDTCNANPGSPKLCDDCLRRRDAFYAKHRGTRLVQPRLVVLESPYRGDTDERTAVNIVYARLCVRDSLLRGEAPSASHLLYTQEGVLDDKVADERNRGIQAGLAWGRVADVTVAYLDLGVSSGMVLGLRRAVQDKRPIEHRWLYDDAATALVQVQTALQAQRMARRRAGGQ